MSSRFDLAVIGGGIVGLATAYRLLLERPSLRLVLLEKETELASHQTGHNSGVLHAGLYYAPGSAKARLCREGKLELERFAAEHSIPFERCGKLVVALEKSELPRLEALRKRALANGVEVEEVGPERIREIEPHAAGIRALWSPSTGVVNFRRAALAMGDEVRRRGGEIRTAAAVASIRTSPGELVLETSAGAVSAAHAVACAGLHADRVASMTGGDGALKIVPFRGDYYTLTDEARELVRGLIYPVPDPRFPFLGVHFTRRIDGQVWAGPNAVLAFAREGYHRTDVSLRDLGEILTFPGFRRLARKNLSFGLAELWRDWSKRSFTAALARYLPEIRSRDLVFGPSGVRAQALAADGTLVEDFAITEGPRILHVQNAPSPAATASLAIGREIAGRAIARFGL